MARFVGTSCKDYAKGIPTEVNTFENFGIGSDPLNGGLKTDLFYLLADEQVDFINGSDGIDRLDYTNADRGLQHAVQFRTFTSYAQHHTAAKNKALVSIEQDGVAAALEKCRELAQEILEKLQAKNPVGLDIRALAEFQVAIERAASVRLDVQQPKG